MKKLNLKALSIFISMLMIILVSFSASAANGAELKNGWITLSDTDSEAPSQTEVSAIRGPGLMLDFNLPGFTFQTVTHDGKKFDKIVFPEQSSLGDDFLGAPNVAMLRHTIGILEDAELSVTITDVDYVEFSDINLEPMQRHLLETETPADREFAFNEDIYSTDAFFPKNWATADTFGEFHGVELGKVELFPVSYNPVQKTVRIAKSLSLTIEFLGERAAKNPANVSPHLTKSLEAMILNYDLMEYPMTRGSYGNGATDYLILTDPKFINSESLKRFAQHYRGKGMTVSIEDVSIIGKTSKLIKAHIQKKYNNNGGNVELDYVLFVSDVPRNTAQGKIPFYQGSQTKSDIWYAWLGKKMDQLADIGLGRFPAKNEAQLKMMVDKSINFNNNVAGGAWRNKALNIANGQLYPGKYTQCIREIEKKHKNNVSITMIEGGNNSKKWKNSDIVAKINEGQFIVNYRGHGSTTAWTRWNLSQQYFDVREAGKLKNGQKTPVTFGIACTNTDLTITGNTISEALVVQEQGAVAYLGATKPSQTTPNHDFDKALFDAVYTKKLQTIGEVFNYGNSVVNKKFPGNKNLYLYLWLGDPALSLVPQASNKVTLTVNVQGNGRVNPNGGTFDKGTTVTLNAIPGSNAKFIGWKGAASGAGTTTSIRMNSNKTVLAQFSDNGPTPGGSIASDSFEGFGWNGGKGWLGPWKKTKTVKKAKKTPSKGKKYARLVGNNSKLERSVDISTATNPYLKFTARVKSFEAGDRALVKVSSNGVSYTEVMVFTIDHSNNTYQTYEIPIRGPKTSRFQIVFETQMDQKKDILFLDDVEILDK